MAISETQTLRSHLREAVARMPRSCPASGRRPVHCGFSHLSAPSHCSSLMRDAWKPPTDVFQISLCSCYSASSPSDSSPMRSAPLRINCRSHGLTTRYSSAFIPVCRPAPRLRPASIFSFLNLWLQPSWQTKAAMRPSSPPGTAQVSGLWWSIRAKSVTNGFGWSVAPQGMLFQQTVGTRLRPQQ